ncbi:MAG: transport-associated protein [Gemmatimonadetes bacterium]|nr:transport-associated protein [Gemmatimonadota bacterium]
MWDFRERDQDTAGQDALTFALGAAGGFALGMLLSGRLKAPTRVKAWSGEVGRRARGVAERLRPSRLRRQPGELGEFTALEDTVLEAFLRDPVLGERGIDVGAISRGIVELSGSVWTDEEAEQAVRLAQRVPGVDTVVNRLEAEDTRRRRPAARDFGEAGEGTTSAEWQGRVTGMGRRRQGTSTDPDRFDDSRKIRERSLERADRAQYEAEGWAAFPRTGERPGYPGNPTNYHEDELDNQDPHGQHAVPVEEQPQQLNTRSRVGEGNKPGTELRLEAADVPVKPHGEVPRDDRLAGGPA